jgi:hypothetical protein
MLLLFSRRIHADSPHWPGRRLVASLDAVAWPVVGVWLIVASPVGGGLSSAVLMAVLAIVCVRRLHRALLLNHRYRCTTWTWGVQLTAVFAMSLMLKALL